MLEKITEQELLFMEDFCDPIAFIETVFGDLDNLARWEDEKFSEVRLAQECLLSYEYFLDWDPTLSTNPALLEKANFRLREGAGNVFCFGGRKFGKTHFVEKLDLLVSIWHNKNEDCGFSSYDAVHIRGVLEEIIKVLENHPLYILLEARINRSPTYRFYLKNGYRLEGVNMNLSGDNPGAQFFQKHFKRLYIEEGSFETDQVYKNRLDSVSENGCVMRVAGMTNFTKYSPAGRVFYDMTKKPWIVNLPQYVNPKWDNKEKEKAIREHGGEESLSYRIFVKGEVVEDGISVFDMERVRRNYNDKRIMKHFEITKENYTNYQQIIIVERPVNAEKIYICADVGESGSSEIIVLSETNRKYKYIYNITLYNLTDKEQFVIFKWLAIELQATFIGLDTTDQLGRAIYRSLEEVFPKENLVWCGFNEKIAVAFEKDELTGKDSIKDGKPVYREEFVDGWSIKRLKDLLYEEGKIELPLDYRFDAQLNSVIATQSGARTLYSCGSDDHLLASWRVFAIAQWFNEFINVKSIMRKNFAKSGV